MALLAALALAASASPGVARAEAVWLPLYQGSADVAAIRLAHIEPDRVEALADGDGSHVLYRQVAGCQGGLSLWLDARDHITDLTCFVAPVGAVWTRATKVRAAALKSPATLDDVLARYGPPGEDKPGKGRRIGVRRLIYEEGGDATRSVVFSSLPFSNGLHAVMVSWERP